MNIAYTNLILLLSFFLLESCKQKISSLDEALTGSQKHSILLQGFNYKNSTFSENDDDQVLNLAYKEPGQKALTTGKIKPKTVGEDLLIPININKSMQLVLSDGELLAPGNCFLFILDLAMNMWIGNGAKNIDHILTKLGPDFFILAAGSMCLNHLGQLNLVEGKSQYNPKTWKKSMKLALGYSLENFLENEQKLSLGSSPKSTPTRQTWTIPSPSSSQGSLASSPRNYYQNRAPSSTDVSSRDGTSSGDNTRGSSPWDFSSREATPTAPKTFGPISTRGVDVDEGTTKFTFGSSSTNVAPTYLFVRKPTDPLSGQFPSAELDASSSPKYSAKIDDEILQQEITQIYELGQIKGEILGTGKSGSVTKTTLNDQEYAIKMQLPTKDNLNQLLFMSRNQLESDTHKAISKALDGKGITEWNASFVGPDLSLIVMKVEAPFKGELSPDIFRQRFELLAQVHEKGFVHGDVAEKNWIGTVLSDFGSARPIDYKGSITSLGTTIYYGRDRLNDQSLKTTDDVLAQGFNFAEYLVGKNLQSIINQTEKMAGTQPSVLVSNGNNIDLITNTQSTGALDLASEIPKGLTPEQFSAAKDLAKDMLNPIGSARLSMKEALVRFNKIFPAPRK